MNFKSFCEQLESKIKSSYEEGVTLEQAEKLAAEFLGAMMVVSGELRKKDLDSRMRKSGVKAVRATIYLDIVNKSDKKPTVDQINSMIEVDKTVSIEQDGLDTAEVDRDDLKRYYEIFEHAHVYYRGIAKGNFNG